MTSDQHFRNTLPKNTMTLRDRLIQAGVQAITDTFEPGQEFESAEVLNEALIKVALDAFLAVLAEHADEWAISQSAKYPLDIVKGVDVLRLLAVLADPEEDTQ